MLILYFRKFLLIVISAIMFCAVLVSCNSLRQPSITQQSETQQEFTVFSGRVLDSLGNPAAGIELGFRPVEIGERNMLSIPTDKNLFKTKTEADGHFSITNIPSVPLELMLLPEDNSDYRINTIEIEGLTLYADEYFYLRKLPFVIERGKHLKNIEIKILPRMKIRGQIVNVDGTPLINAYVKLDIQPRRLWDNRERRFEGAIWTDSDGYFSEFVLEAATYTVSVEHHNLSAISRPIVLNENEHYDTLVLKLSERTPSNKNDELKTQKTGSSLTSFEKWQARQAVWAVNPANGHAYKTISCNSWREAYALAEAENAYLVTINDEAEQKWIENLFSRNEFFWIGLRISKTDQQWHSRESVKYNNWSNQDSNNLLTDEGEIYVAMDPDTKKWIGFDSNSPFTHLVRNAVIEKELRSENKK